jgi:hypothetical protein
MSRYLKTPQTIKELLNAKKVNYFNGRELGQSYYVSEKKFCKKMRSGDCRQYLL